MKLSVIFFLKDIKEIFQLYYIFLLYTKVTEHEKKKSILCKVHMYLNTETSFVFSFVLFYRLVKHIPIGHAYNV